MGDRGHNRHGPKRREGCCAPFAGELGPRLTQCGLGRGLRLYQVASSSIHPFGHNRHGPKLGGGVPFFWGEVDPIEHKVAWDEAYLHTRWHLSPSSRLVTTDIRRKLGAVPFRRGELRPHLTQCRLG